MKRMTIAKERTLNGNTYYIYPFAAFVSVNLGGELMSFLTPVLGGVMPIIADVADDVSVFDMDTTKVAPMIGEALSGIDGDKVEKMLKKLIVEKGNVAVQLEGESEAVTLTEDIANEAFCGEVQDMFILAFDVIQANFKGFFKKLGSQFGSLQSLMAKMGSPSSKSTAN